MTAEGFLHLFHPLFHFAAVMKCDKYLQTHEPQATGFLQLSSNISPQENTEESSPNLVSRLHLNDEKRKAKEHMEEKMREEAKCKAVEEKMAKKQVLGRFTTHRIVF